MVLVLPQYDFPGRQQEALNKLQAYIQDNRIRTTGDFFFRYFSNMERAIPEEPCWEVGVPVERGTVSTLPFEIKVIPDQLYVSSNAACEPEQIDWYWKTFALRSQIKGYFINGPPMRILREGALDGTTANEFRHPVRKKIRNPQHLPVFN